MQDITARKRAEQEVTLLLELTQAISSVPDFLQALDIALTRLCAATGWHYGEARLPNAEGTELICRLARFDAPGEDEDPAIVQALERFRRYSLQLCFRPQEGLPGRVWARGKPEWVSDVSIESHNSYTRARLAKECGLRAECGVPILLPTSQGNGAAPPVLAVLVFFMLEARDRDRRLLQLVSAVAAQLGTVMQQKQAEAELRREQEKSEQLLLNILPAPIAARLKQGESAIAENFTAVTILFADIVGFTRLASRRSAFEVVSLLNELFSTFDRLAERYGLEKIKTIGDAYMVVGGLPVPRPDSAAAVADMALAMQSYMRRYRDQPEPLHIRIGINTGPVVAGVIGLKKFSYDLWGDAVNIASRLESAGEPDKIHISQATAACLRDRFRLQARGRVALKGKGEMATYWLLGRCQPARTAGDRGAAPTELATLQQSRVEP